MTADISGWGNWPLEYREQELKRLAYACGVKAVHSLTCRRDRINPKLFIGKGKTYELGDAVLDQNADVVIFNNDLSSSQQKNLEGILGIKTIDRTQLILDIFANRAKSKEGKIQVELAQLLYLLPRLSGKGIHLSRLGGGVGTKGPGEQKLEVDRRRIRTRISKLKSDLKEITGKRKVMKARRSQFGMRTIALVGYTNSGKSTLFNALTNSSILAKDQLFSTLDPTVRKMELSDKRTVLLSDTVGFVNDLPHHLVESFKATLEEVVEADILFFVVDISDERANAQKQAVYSVLRELSVLNKHIVTVLNKIDRIEINKNVKRFSVEFDDPVFVSALNGERLDRLKAKVMAIISEKPERLELALPHEYYSISSLIREKGRVIKQEYDEKGLFISAEVPKYIKKYILKKLKKQTGKK